MRPCADTAGPGESDWGSATVIGLELLLGCTRSSPATTTRSSFSLNSATTFWSECIATAI
eukprot:1375178-Prymnesium_polylepis.2